MVQPLKALKQNQKNKIWKFFTFKSWFFETYYVEITERRLTLHSWKYMFTADNDLYKCVDSL